MTVRVRAFAGPPMRTRLTVVFNSVNMAVAYQRRCRQLLDHAILG